MPAWLARFAWWIRGRRFVRIQLTENYGAIEGILVGRWGGHYHAVMPKYIEGEGRSYTLDGEHVEVPAERVVFVQVLARGAR